MPHSAEVLPAAKPTRCDADPRSTSFEPQRSAVSWPFTQGSAGLRAGGLGVNLFFVLSGHRITQILLREVRWVSDRYSGNDTYESLLRRNGISHEQRHGAAPVAR